MSDRTSIVGEWKDDEMEHIVNWPRARLTIPHELTDVCRRVPNIYTDGRHPGDANKDMATLQGHDNRLFALTRYVHDMLDKACVGEDPLRRAACTHDHTEGDSHRRAQLRGYKRMARDLRELDKTAEVLVELNVALAVQHRSKRSQGPSKRAGLEAAKAAAVAAEDYAEAKQLKQQIDNL